MGNKKVPMVATALALSLMCLSGAARAEIKDAAVATGVGMYEYGDYPKAIETLTRALEQGVPDAQDRTSARTYLASALHVRGELERARRVIEELLLEFPGAEADAALFPPAFVGFFEGVRQEIRGRLPASDAPRVATLPLPPPPPELVAVPEPKTNVAPLGLAFVPFGVGQFTNHSPRKGAFFLTSEVLAFGTAAVALTAFESKKLPGSAGLFGCSDATPCMFNDEVQANRLQTTFVAAFYTGVALAVLGVVDAVLENRSLASEASAPE